MLKEQAKTELIDPKLRKDEKLIGFFTSTYMPSSWWYFLLGPFISFGLRQYIVGITELGIHLNKLSLWGKPDTHNFFQWNEIESLHYGKGMLTAPLKLKFANGRKIKLKVQLKGVEKVAKINDETKAFLISKATGK